MIRNMVYDIEFNVLVDITKIENITCIFLGDNGYFFELLFNDTYAEYSDDSMKKITVYSKGLCIEGNDHDNRYLTSRDFLNTEKLECVDFGENGIPPLVHDKEDIKAIRVSDMFIGFENGTTVKVRPEALDVYNNKMQDAMSLG